MKPFTTIEVQYLREMDIFRFPGNALLFTLYIQRKRPRGGRGPNILLYKAIFYPAREGARQLLLAPETPVEYLGRWPLSNEFLEQLTKG